MKTRVQFVTADHMVSRLLNFIKKNYSENGYFIFNFNFASNFFIFFKVQGKLKQLNCNVIDRNVSLELIIIHRFFIYMLYIFFISDSS